MAHCIVPLGWKKNQHFFGGEKEVKGYSRGLQEGFPIVPAQ